jgi:hypothetical protein
VVERTHSEEIDAIIASSIDWRGPKLAELRRVIRTAAPGIVEEVKWKKPSRPEGVPVWAHDGIVCIGEMLKAAVRLTFPKGAELPDPEGLFNARLNSKAVRAIDVREKETVPVGALKALVREAVRVNAASR